MKDTGKPDRVLLIADLSHKEQEAENASRIWKMSRTDIAVPEMAKKMPATSGAKLKQGEPHPSGL